MNNSIQTFGIALPVNDEMLNLTLFLFYGKPVQNHRKDFTYSIVCKVNGMEIKFLSAAITANYGHGFILTDCPVIKEKEFIFSNQSSRPVTLLIRTEVKTMSADGSLISAIFMVEVKNILQSFIISNIRMEYSIKKETKLYPASHIYSHHSLAAG